MGQFSSDSFTTSSSVALEIYSASWAKFSGDNSMSVSADYDRVYYSTNSATRYNNTAASPASADYSVSVDVYVASTLAGSCAGPIGRSNGSNTFYLARTVQGTGYQMFKCVSGSYTQLGSTSTKTFSSSTTYNVKLEMIGTAIKTYVEGSGTASISATDSAISSAGYPGIYKYESGAGSETTGHHIDNFSADEAGGGTTYNYDYADALTLDATQTSTGVFVTGYNDALTLGDTKGNVVLFPAAYTDALTLADSSIGEKEAGSFVRWYEEALTLGDSYTTTLISVNAITEPLTLMDEYTNTGIFPSAYSDALTLADSAIQDSAKLGDITEALTLADSYTNVLIGVASYDDNTTLTDELTTTGEFSSTISEALTLTDTQTGTIPSTGGSISDEDIDRIADEVMSRLTEVPVRRL